MLLCIVLTADLYVTLSSVFLSEQGRTPSLQKVSVLCEVGSAHRIVFTSDSTWAVVSTGTGDIFVIRLAGDELTLERVLHPLDDKCEYQK
jgi:hypothetical protein